MDKTYDKIILDDTPKDFSSNEKHETPNFIHDQSPSSANGTVPFVNDNHLSNEEKITDETSAPSDSSIQQPQNTSTSNKDGKYRIHLGTQPGFCTESHMTFTESKKLHSKVIDFLEQFLSCSNITYEFIKKDAFSNSAWGLEPYACLVLLCSNEIARGLAAIIGLAFRQDAIGIYTNNDDVPTHPVFTVTKSDNSLFTQEETLILMKRITKPCTSLSGQFDKNCRNIELHDFENKNDKSLQQIQIITNHLVGNLYHITESTGQSDLLEKDQYQNAINQAGFQSFSKLIELTRLHDDLYRKSEST
jgi:hypothetical protein